uniref:Protein-glucosylgalactosylhydroxylysine glucosidase n=1 Tax=Loxodonta africana TaxID=9785 RepID=G3TC16_LOXAF
MDDASEDPAIFTAHSLPSDPRLWAPVTSAYLGTRVYHDVLHVSGLYNGAGGDTHRATLPSPLNVQLESPAESGEQLTETFALDTNTGSFLHTLEGTSFRASQRLYAHRTLPHVLVFSVSIARVAAESRPITVQLRAAFSPESPDLDLHLGPDFQGALRSKLECGPTRSEGRGSPHEPLLRVWLSPWQTHMPRGAEAGQGGSQGKSWASVWAVETARGASGLGTARSWARWVDSREAPGGDRGSGRPCRPSLMHTGSKTCQGSVRAGGGLRGPQSPSSSQNKGPFVCSQDLWMFPNVLMFHPEAARAILEYRIRTLGGALKNAHNLGYQGAKFAWESAGSGLEVCPEDIYGVQEVHINGAVVLAFELYYYTTQDVQLFQDAGGWDLVSAVAEFWCSRVEWSPGEKKYHLRGVMPPDEFHSGVNNSVYTNVLVQNSLRFAAALAEDLGLPVPDRWLVVADKIKVPFDPELNFHPEFDGYRLGEEVKQADVVLLGYPIPFPLNASVRRRNLEVYEAVTSPHGPAMTWSMFAVGWMELKDPGRVEGLLDRSFANITEPFNPFTLRITRAGITFDPMCPAGVSGVFVSGLFYQGSKLNFSFSEDSVTIELTTRAGPWAPPLEAELRPSLARLPLPPGHKVSFPRSAGQIRRSPL